jgi:hypothetical protein
VKSFNRPLTSLKKSFNYPNNEMTVQVSDYKTFSYCLQIIIHNHIYITANVACIHAYIHNCVRAYTQVHMHHQNKSTSIVPNMMLARLNRTDMFTVAPCTSRVLKYICITEHDEIKEDQLFVMTLYSIRPPDIFSRIDL